MKCLGDPQEPFGEGWGELGYFKLERGAHTLDREGFGTCGMYLESVYPVMDESPGADAFGGGRRTAHQVRLGRDVACRAPSSSGGGDGGTRGGGGFFLAVALVGKA